MTSWDQATPEEILADIKNFKAKIEKDYKEGLALWALLNHIQYKVNVGELKYEIAEKMVASIRDGGPQDYRKLYIAAVRLPLPSEVYHSAPREFRAQIAAEGLRMALPSDGPWNMNAAAQPRAVYAAPEPDRIGLWALTEEWDIWEIDTGGLLWQHDDLNVGCYAILRDIPAGRIRLFETRTLVNRPSKVVEQT